MTDTIDIAIIGAGAAGIAAARTLSHTDHSTLLLEASSRIGGRALTDHSLGHPLDLGCTWLHSADRNVLADPPADQYGQDAVRSSLYLEDEGFWASPAERAGLDEYQDRCEAAIKAAAAAGDKRAIAEIVPGHPKWRRHFEWWCGAYTSVGSGELGALDWVRYQDSEVNWTVPHGLGTHIVRKAQGLPIRLQTPLLGLDRRASDHVALITPQGRLRARTVILTASTAALARLPVLPAWPAQKADAIANLPLGRANKAVFRLNRLDPEWQPARSGVLSLRFGRFGRPTAEAFVESALARQLEPEGADAQIAFVADQMAAMYGTKMRRQIQAGRASTWGSTPWIWGAYSAALPGSDDPRADLAEPVEERIFFAGEATHPTYFTAAHGAWESGARAAREALRALQQTRQ